LYYSTTFFFFLLGNALSLGQFRRSIGRIMVLGATVVVTCALVFLPFLDSRENFFQVLHRMFPFARGLFEDKVANFWCISSLFIKWKEIFPLQTLVRFSLLGTVASVLPSGLAVLIRPTKQRFLYALASGSLSFFLFSFQVHEKSILFPLLPVTLLAFDNIDLWASFSFIASFSMFPLLVKDGLVIPYIACQLIFLAMWQLASIYLRDAKPLSSSLWLSFCKLQSRTTVCIAVLLQLALPFIPVPSKYPDLVPVVYAAFSFVHFMYFLIVLNVHLWMLPHEEPSENKKTE
jgi:alpha-1,3-glucosyltransferase